MKKKYILYPLIVLLCLCLSGLGAYLFALNKLEMREVYVATINLPQRTLIKEEYLKTIKVPKSIVPDNIYLNKEDIINCYVKLDNTIPENSMFYLTTLDKLDNAKDSAHLSLKEDEITYDLFVKDINVNPANLMKDMHVDLYLTINRKEVVSDLLISGVRIVGLYDVNDNEIKNYDTNATLKTISIAVKQEMIALLNKAISIGDVGLFVASNPYEEKEAQINQTNVFDNYLK